MTKPFQDNPEKGVVREVWDTPLLKHLHQRHRIRYRYLGLPGVDLIDIRLWKSMIDEVIAFEPPGQPPNKRKAIDELRRNMKLLGRRGIAYWGSFEEVVMLRRDFEGQHYAQDKVVTLYNLDFCDEITSKVETQRQGKKAWRFEAIRQILRDQAACFQRERRLRHFIMMLTIRNQTSSHKIQQLLSGSTLLAQAKTHHEVCNELTPIPAKPGVLLIGTHTWALKTAIFNYLLSCFNNPCLSALFFPPVLYIGTPIHTWENGKEKLLSSPMLHCIILCRFADAEQVAPECWPTGYLAGSCVSVRPEGELAWTPQVGEAGGSVRPPQSVEWLTTHGAQILKGL